MPSLRFDDTNLQTSFTNKLREAHLPFGLGHDGSVQFDEKDRQSINSVAHTIRDGCFRWYFSWGMEPDTAEQFERILKTKGMQFQIEHHDDGKVYLLPKSDEQEHQRILAEME